MSKLFDIGVKHQCIKCDDRWKYAHAYCKEYYPHHLSRLRKYIKNVLEIGTAKGGSLRMWNDWFPNANIYGIDINNSYEDQGHERIHFRQGDQNDVEFLEKLSAEVCSWDFVVDDGGHSAEAIITSFKTLWPHVNEGGIYAVEDLMDGHKKSWTAFDYFLQLARDNCRWTKGFTTDIKRIVFYPGGLIIIEKKEGDVDPLGVPRFPSMTIEYDDSKMKEPSQTKYHPIWKLEDKPWGGYPHKTQHSSSEAHWLYRTTLQLGIGNYANLGVFRGGSMHSIATALKQLNGGKVYGVDLFEVNGAETVAELERVFKELGTLKYAQFCKGYTHEWPEKLKHLKFKMIFIDADHHYETCKRDFELWSPFLEKGGLLAFHDVHMNTVNRVLEEELNDWDMIDHVWKIKSYRRKEDA